MFSILVIPLLALFLGLFVAIFITRSAPPTPIQFAPPEDDEAKDPKDIRALELADLYRLGEKICEKNDLVLKNQIPISETEVYWVAESKNELFWGSYVLGFHKSTVDHPYISMSTILEFKDFIKSVTSAKGLYLTTGYYTKDVYQPLEGPKVNLYNRLKILQEMKELGLSF
ncbi:MAG: hypothetical protein EB078_01270 [Proteobacteria bacterium]|nr:hypothetical protein [Pseudomonadota bacterium]NDC24089.1 hypothetical protein [Pseudomonadota bacterium]NDD03510.1 hypothetical protein [Pseudomonadota bacterium]NDG27384.1 hypothetical protein [Pseudomonadota bacterium]